jgi:inorganic pyrophosphatase
MLLEKIKPYEHGLLNVIIETPRGSKHKYNYNEELETFILKKTMPLGAAFPFDFGFIPNTLAEDGDPIDVLIIMDEPAFPGCLTSCRLIGVLEATQKERDGKETRNDRLVAVAKTSVIHEGTKELGDLVQTMQDQIADFFINYNRQAGKEFKPIRWADAGVALELVEKGSKKS